MWKPTPDFRKQQEITGKGGKHVHEEAQTVGSQGELPRQQNQDKTGRLRLFRNGAGGDSVPASTTQRSPGSFEPYRPSKV